MSLSESRALAGSTVTWPVGFAAIGLFLIVLPQTGYFHGIPGGFADSRFNSFILEHVYRWLSGTESSLWSPRFFYPYQDVLAFSDTHLGSVPVYALFRIAGLDRYTAYAAWFAAGCLLNFVSANECLRRFAFSPPAAGIGAFVFAFSMPAMAQADHTQLIYRCAIPPAVLALQRLLDSRNPAYAGAIAVWATLQFYFAPYTGLFTMLMLAIWTMISIVLRLHGRDKLKRCLVVAHVVANSSRRRDWALALAGVMVSLIALGFLLGRYWLVSKAFGLTRWYEGGAAAMLPRFGSLLLADQSWLWGWLSRSVTLVAMRDEHQLFIGLGAWILVSIAVFRSRQTAVWAAAGTVCVTFFLTCSLGGHSLYWIVDSLPGFKSIRFAVRIWLVLLFPIAFLVSASIASIEWRHHATGTALRLEVLVTLAAILLVVESTAVYRKFLPTKLITARIDELRSRLPVPLPKDLILFSASAPRFAANASEIDAMTVAQETGITTLNGYSAFAPTGYNFSLPKTCQQGALMLSMYIARTGADPATFERMAGHVVAIGFDHCDPATWSLLAPQRGPLPSVIFDRLSLAVQSISDRVVGQLLANVTIQNRSGSVLHPMSLNDNGVLLSWRFVDVASGLPLEDWFNRFDLPIEIGAGQTATVALPIVPPRTSGRYRLQVSMVQEHVSWLFQHGVAPALSSEIISVSAGSFAVTSSSPSANFLQ